jgi:hypothetical protein
MRHTLALVEGEDLAEDSKIHHLAHIGANVVLVLDAKKHDCLIDDRHVSSVKNTKKLTEELLADHITEEDRVKNHPTGFVNKQKRGK